MEEGDNGQLLLSPKDTSSNEISMYKDVLNPKSPNNTSEH